MFNQAYKNKKVLITGHTGFKGSWLALWLTSLGAKVTGISSYLPSEPCNFDVITLADIIDHREADIRDLKNIQEIFMDVKPDIVFHLAAQPIVRKSYTDPKLTFDTNLGGTVNVLECIRSVDSVKAAVLITSDKCYRNVEWNWGYRENDILGGDDPYSASKACAEIATQSYVASFFNPSGHKCQIVTTRAGNVIGGGDWAQDRIVPDCVRAWAKGDAPEIRNPKATRPWQHVLEPLGGYLWLGARMLDNPELHGEAFNFGPDQKVNQPVSALIDMFTQFWADAKWKDVSAADSPREANLLKLSCDKALALLQWSAVLNFRQTIEMTASWYKTYYSGSEDMRNYTLKQIQSYAQLAKDNQLPWAQE